MDKKRSVINAGLHFCKEVN